jgi:hypothetical protein
MSGRGKDLIFSHVDRHPTLADYMETRVCPRGQAEFRTFEDNDLALEWCENQILYALRGDGREPVDPVPAREQRAALDALMTTLAPAELALPRGVLDRLPPRPAGYGRHRELFPRFTGTRNAQEAGLTVRLSVGDCRTLDGFESEVMDLMVDNHVLHCLIGELDRRPE